MKVDQWTPRLGSRVRIQPRLHAPDDEAPPPSGIWKILDRAPDPRTWWLLPVDDESRAWAATHRDQTVSGCVQAASHRIHPVDRIKL